MATTALAQEKVWFDKPSYDKAERLHFERLAKGNESNCTLKKLCFKDTKAFKKREERTPEKIKVIEKFDDINMENKEAASVSNNTKKCKPKEVKEKKNEADKRHRNKEEEKSNAKEQLLLFNQGSQQSTCPIFSASGSLASEVAKARQHIKQSLQCMDSVAAYVETPNQDIASRIGSLEKENQDLRNIVQDLKNIIGRLDGRVKVLEQGKVLPTVAAVSTVKPTATPSKSTAKDDDDDVDLFGSDSEGEDTEAARIREERLAAYAAKKSKKPALIAKSNIILDVKPWDDETDMKEMEVEVRKIETDGLLWGAAQLVPLAFGIHKLQISCVVEDDKVSVDWLTEQIQSIEDFVQSVDIAAFNKV